MQVEIFARKFVQAALEKVCHPVMQQKVQPCPRRECWEVQMFPCAVTLSTTAQLLFIRLEIRKELTGEKNAETNEKRETRENGTSVTQEQQQRY
jgi:hypothetical protein